MIRDVTEEEKNTYFVMETDYNIHGCNECSSYSVLSCRIFSVTIAKPQRPRPKLMLECINMSPVEMGRKRKRLWRRDYVTKIMITWYCIPVPSKASVFSVYKDIFPSFISTKGSCYKMDISFTGSRCIKQQCFRLHFHVNIVTTHGTFPWGVAS